MLETVTIPPELKLEPRLIQGELVPDGWWETPAPERVSFLRRHWLFLVTVVLPVTLGGIYFGLIAADQYTSETQFIVRASTESGLGNLASLMSGQKISRATDETYAVGQYMTSRDAMMDLIRDHHLRDIFASSDADFINRYPNLLSRNKDEELYRHYKRYVQIENDPESGISTLTVYAFTPTDAQRFADSLVGEGEALINRLNKRAYQDALRFATQLVDEQKTKLVDAERALTNFRNESKIVDPKKELTASFTILATMTAELLELKADYAQKSAITASNPALAPLRQRIAAYEEQIAKQRKAIAGDDSSVASKLSTFEQLILTRELASKGLEAAVVHLTSARQDAEQQRLYLETIVRANAPDEALHPRRILSMILLGVISLCVFWIVRAFAKAAMEHQD